MSNMEGFGASKPFVYERIKLLRAVTQLFELYLVQMKFKQRNTF